MPYLVNNIVPITRAVFLEPDEADISTVEYQTQAQARFPRTHGHQGRPQDSGRPTRTWSYPTHPCLTPFPAHMTASGQLTSFPKSSRIQASADFRANRERGSRLAKGCMLANWQSLRLTPRLGLASSPAGALARRTFATTPDGSCGNVSASTNTNYSSRLTWYWSPAAPLSAEDSTRWNVIFCRY